jgi:hypothetical protein
VRKPKHARSNLTTRDWLEVVAYADANPHLSQADVCKHFANNSDGALHFDQSNLSRHLTSKGRTRDQARVESNPGGLSAKRIRVVTRPDVEQMLWLWVQHMEEKGEQVTGPMLEVKRTKFEDLLKVPQEERLKTKGWLPNFCKAYGIRERRRHGEAGSVDVQAVATERKRLAEILKMFLPKNIFNFDETGLFGQ